MKTALFSVLISFLFVCFSFSAVFSEQVACAADGREVIVMENGRWEYAHDAARSSDRADSPEALHIIDLNERTKETLRPFILDRNDGSVI